LTCSISSSNKSKHADSNTLSLFFAKTRKKTAIIFEPVFEELGEYIMKHITLYISLLLLAFPAYAINDFKCVVKEVYDLKRSGLLTPGPGFVTPEIGSEFSVNRQSGQITAKKITNTMSGVMPRVYSVNPAENFYTAITIYEANYTVDLLQISEYVEETEKPFIFKGAFGEVVTGLCLVQ
jgi:hypothetical protein